MNRKCLVDITPAGGSLAALAAFAWASTSAEASCGWVEEYSVRLCTSSRALRTCNSTWIVAPGVNTTCGWRDDCQRCVSPPEAFETPCALDGLSYGMGGGCPTPHDDSFCEKCELIVTQEVCLGLCSENCKWKNVSWMSGEHCELRDPEPEVDDNTLIMVLIIAGGVIGLIALIVGFRVMATMRRRALEAQSNEMRNRISDRFSGLGQVAAPSGTAPVMTKRPSDRPSEQRPSAVGPRGSEGAIMRGSQLSADGESSQRLSEKRASLQGVSPDLQERLTEKRASLQGISPEGLAEAAGSPTGKKKKDKGKKGEKKDEDEDSDEEESVSTEEDDIQKYMTDEHDEEEDEDIADAPPKKMAYTSEKSNKSDKSKK